MGGDRERDSSFFSKPPEPYYFFVVGIAGGIRRPSEREPIQLGDVVIPDYIHYSELARRRFSPAMT
jgi:nucleoside phosphorylase